MQAKNFSYEVSLDRDGTATSSDGGSPLANEEAWSPEHLVLAGLARCTLTSLDYHAHRAGLVSIGSATALGKVTKRDSDGRYAFVEVEVRLEVDLDPAPDGGGVRELVAKAERDCFVGASLTPSPRYVWTVDGKAVS
jgi:organic hydroperoxide reductase OsmC/OhrA